jgi:hypothetical protein
MTQTLYADMNKKNKNKNSKKKKNLPHKKTKSWGKMYRL